MFNRCIFFFVGLVGFWVVYGIIVLWFIFIMKFCECGVVDVIFINFFSVGLVFILFIVWD